MLRPYLPETADKIFVQLNTADNGVGRALPRLAAYRRGRAGGRGVHPVRAHRHPEKSSRRSRRRSRPRQTAEQPVVTFLPDIPVRRLLPGGYDRVQGARRARTSRRVSSSKDSNSTTDRVRRARSCPASPSITRPRNW